jgi:NosR/NirI family transcriptional regulator, nitrous oxide reductase regulator
MSKRFRLNWQSWTGLILGTFLLLFCIAWTVGTVLEGVPRAASMGIILFAFPGIVLLTLTLRYVNTKLERVATPEGPPIAVPEEMPLGVSKDVPSRDVGLVEPKAKPRDERRALGVGLRYAAYIALVAAFVAGKAIDPNDLKNLVKTKYPDTELTEVNADPLVYQIGKKDAGQETFLMVAEGQGYGGPFVVGIRVGGDAKIQQVTLLADRETPAYAERVKQANFGQQFVGKKVNEDFIVGVDIDAVSGATVSTMAGTEAIRKAAHTAALQKFKMKRVWKSVPWKFGLGEILILVIFALAFVPKVHSQKPWKYLYLAASVVIVGFYLNASLSISSLSGLVLGYIPGLRDHLTWWILVAGTILAIVIVGKNVYCYKVCPFYGVQYVLTKISGMRLKLPPALLRRSRLIANFFLWLSLMIIFLSSYPALGSYEPFAMMFSLEGIGVQWYILPAALVGAFFMSNFWCNFFCPFGNALRHLLKFRRRIRSMLGQSSAI